MEVQDRGRAGVSHGDCAARITSSGAATRPDLLSSLPRPGHLLGETCVLRPGSQWRAEGPHARVWAHMARGRGQPSPFFFGSPCSQPCNQCRILLVTDTGATRHGRTPALGQKCCTTLARHLRSTCPGWPRGCCHGCGALTHEPTTATTTRHGAAPHKAHMHVHSGAVPRREATSQSGLEDPPAHSVQGKQTRQHSPPGGGGLKLSRYGE